MKSMISYSKILVGMACAITLAACDSIKDVPDEPYALPAQNVSLSGTIVGLSSVRAITLMNNGDGNAARSFIPGAPGVPNTGPSVTPFSFGALPVGQAYNVTIKDQPFGKTCSVTNGQGTLQLGVDTNIQIQCNNTSPRYKLTVVLPSNPDLFTNLPGAKVRLTTEEEIFEKPVVSGQATVEFPDALIDAFGQANAATWSVNASFSNAGVVGKCVVNNGDGSVAAGGANAGHTATTPASNWPRATATTFPVVGTPTVPSVPAVQTLTPCQFTVGGVVGYSQPAGTAYSPTAITGLKMGLLDPQANVLDTADITCTPSSAAVSTANINSSVTSTLVPVATAGAASGCGYTFSKSVLSSSTSGLYEVAVVQHPANQHCVVVNGGAANVFTTGLTPPLRITGANAFCRAIPGATKQLYGVFRLQKSTWRGPAGVDVVSEWKPFDFTVQNSANSNMIAFFKDGTFLYGTHGATVQIEQGFYDYDPNTHKLAFTLVTDTNASMSFPANFSPNNSAPVGVPWYGVANNQTTTPGISATPNPVSPGITGAATNAYASQFVMSNVVLGTAPNGLGTGNARTISGTFGTDPAGRAVSTTTPCSATAPCIAATANSNTLQWVLQEPPSINGEFTGAWVTENGRRLWVWDYRTLYGTGVATVGGSASMNDACFNLENEYVHASEGFYIRRPSNTGCYPFNRPSAAMLAAPAFTAGSYLVGSNQESVDFAPLAFTSMPGYIGRFPGGQVSAGTFSVSPNFFYIAPAATFFDNADPIYFPKRFPDASAPETSLAWCQTEILGLRSTSNGFPINYPVYMCRTSSGP